MASPYIRKDSPYIWICYKDLDGRTRSKNSKYKPEQWAEAEKLCRALERQADLTPKIVTALTVSEWAERWFIARETKIKSIKDDRSRIRTHILPRIGAVELRRLRKADVQAVFDELRAEYERKALASGTIRSIYSATKVMFMDAVAEDIIPLSPLCLTSRTLPSVHKERTLPYTIEEIETILKCPDIPDDRKTLYSILFFHGLRFGEGAALRWRDYDETTDPLPKLYIGKSWSHSRHKTDTTKTGAGTERDAPVHPTAQIYIEHWRRVGFPALFKREPTPDDLIVPSRLNKERNSNHGMKKLRKDLTKAKLTRIEDRTQHAFRTSYISILRAVDVNKDKVRAVTHGHRSSKDVIDAFYTVWPWAVLCEAVLKIPLSEDFLRFSYAQAKSLNLLGENGGADGTRSLVVFYTDRYREQIPNVDTQSLASVAPSSAAFVGAFPTASAHTTTPLPTGMPEPLTMEEILGDSLGRPAEAPLLRQSFRTKYYTDPGCDRNNTVMLFHPSDWLRVRCNTCGDVDALEGGTSQRCPLCEASISLQCGAIVVE